MERKLNTAVHRHEKPRFGKKFYVVLSSLWDVKDEVGIPTSNEADPYPGKGGVRGFQRKMKFHSAYVIDLR